MEDHAGIQRWVLGSLTSSRFRRSNKFYRILRDKNGRHVSIEIDAEAAKTRLCKIKNKTVVQGGKVQLNMRDGANILADNTYKPGDSIVVSLEPETRFKIIDHFPFAVGNMAMVIGGTPLR